VTASIVNDHLDQSIATNDVRVLVADFGAGSLPVNIMSYQQSDLTSSYSPCNNVFYHGMMPYMDYSSKS
jgi:hypothetical protein